MPLTPAKQVQVGRRNKGAVLRGAERTSAHEDTIVSNIFRGAFKSCVRSPGQQPSATVQPFTVLHLELERDSQRDCSVDAAIARYCAPERLNDYAVGGETAAATKEVKLYQLPQVRSLPTCVQRIFVVRITLDGF